MGCSCSSGLREYVPSTSRSTITTTGRVIGSSMRGLAHFSEYVPATERSYIKTTGAVESVPNATGGMHIGNHSRAGMGDIFGAGQTNWISGVPNEYIVAGGLLIVLLGVMK